MGLYHAFDIEFFNGNHAEPIDELARLLMHKVVTTVLDTLMYTPNDFLCGFACFGTVLGFDCLKLALGFSKSLFFFAKETRVFNELAIGECRKGFQPNVNANRLRILRRRLGFIVAGKADIPFLAFSADGTGFDCARVTAV